MTSDKRTFWLRAGAALVIASGALIALGSHPAIAAPLRLVADLLIWPFDGLQPIETSEARLLAAIGGGVLVGWGVMLWQLAPEPAAHRIIRTSVLAWFVVDSGGSLLAGVPLNVVGNLVFLALFLIPIGFGRRAQAA